MIDEKLPEAEDVSLENFVRDVTSEEGNVRLLVAKLLTTIMQKGIGTEAQKILEDNKNNKEFMSLAKTMVDLATYVRY